MLKLQHTRSEFCIKGGVITRRGALFFIFMGILSILFAQEDVTVNGVTLITKVFPEGEKACAVVIEYPVEIDGQKLSPDRFSVKVKTSDTYSSRTITKVYANNSGDLSFSIFNNRGKYVVLELSTEDLHSNTIVFGPNFLNTRVKLDYIVSQLVPIFDVDGNEVEPFTSKQTDEKHLIIDDFLAFTFKDPETGVEIPYRLFVPKDVNPDRKYPLVVFLHGAGERGTDNYLQVAGNRGAVVWAQPRYQVVHPCFVLAPQCPPNSSWSTLFTDRKNPFNPEKPLLAVIKIIRKLLDEYNIDENRIYITGLSMGGYGTWSAIMNFPELFAAAIPICGGGDVSKVERIKDIPIWVFHAEDDPVVPVENSRVLVKKLAEIGGKVRYTEYEKGFMEKHGWDPHGSWIPAYESQEVVEWLFEQSR
ncbi:MULTISPECIES: prolyl oligopeptidase family serine peptidase [unclassified Thermotoga]|uniref:carboxylesterase family protein n=2 Tax=unclassified Thermotoga TaxID=2631113 RepID=UPI00056E0F0A|nr:phospholipase [Thermotoga sp. 38H-to]